MRRVAALYVETFRNIPVLVIILFWYLGVMIRLPPIREAVELLELLADLEPRHRRPVVRSR